VENPYHQKTFQLMPNSKSSLKDIALLFLKLGLTAFGGPAAHIAMMRQEVVVCRAQVV
jgi:chromate transporter